MATAKKFEDLICWQLGDELKVRVLRILRRPTVAIDVDFCRQIRKSVRGVPALISEGFARRQKEFKRYLELALGELNETRNHLRDGAQCGHVTIEEYRDLWHLCYRARRATLEMHQYLDRCIQEEERRRKKKPPDKT